VIRQAASIAVGVLFAAGGAVLADTPPGNAVFDRNCAVCHAPGREHPGTQRLAELRGAARAVLEKRTDLDPDYIRHVVRHGLVEMPPWRPTELDDASLTQLVQYLTRGPAGR
jgi:mono/diheme cytochrome c family protein